MIYEFDISKTMTKLIRGRMSIGHKRLPEFIFLESAMILEWISPITKIKIL